MDKNKVIKRSRLGKVIADSSNKTMKVEIEGIIQHPRYKKYIKRHTRFLVHDPENSCRAGDTVRVEECRPISKSKHWVLCEIVKSTHTAEGEQV